MNRVHFSVAMLHSFARVLLSFNLILNTIVSFTLADETSTTPLPFKWSSNHYGPDGPWLAVTVQLGSQKTAVDLFPGTTYASIVLDGSFCQLLNLNAGAHTTCLAKPHGLWNFGQSKTTEGTLYRPNPDWTEPLAIEGLPTLTIMDNMWITTLIGQYVPIFTSFEIVLEASNVYPNGLKIPPTLGMLSLGAPMVNETFRFGNNELYGPDLNASITTSWLSDQKVIPSASFGLHVGSAVAGIPGSLWYGGYDMSRVIGTVAAQPYTMQETHQGAIFGIELIDIGSTSARGNDVGLLAAHNSTIKDRGSLSVVIKPSTPYMFLPRSVCDAMTAHLPVTFNKNLGLYFWNTKDPEYSTLVQSASYFSFSFRSPSAKGSLTINVPWILLNLTLTPPLVIQTTRYFPCYPVENGYTLGRAFLQAAFLGVNWEPHAAPGNWFLAQAPGPNTQTTSATTSIGPTDKTISGSKVSWESTWNGYWTPLPVRNDSSSGNHTGKPDPDNHHQSHLNPSPGLSLAARVGIGLAIGIVVVLVATLAFCVVWRKKRRKCSGSGYAVTDWDNKSDIIDYYHADLRPSRLAPGQAQSYSFGGWGPAELEADRWRLFELQAREAPRLPRPAAPAHVQPGYYKEQARHPWRPPPGGAGVVEIGGPRTPKWPQQ